VAPEIISVIWTPLTDSPLRLSLTKPLKVYDCPNVELTKGAENKMNVTIKVLRILIHALRACKSNP
jgi:hypothetical protein